MDRPNQNVSYADLRTQGWEIEFKEVDEIDGVKQYRVSSCRLNKQLCDEDTLLAGLSTLGVDLNVLDEPLGIDFIPHISLTKGAVVDYRFYAPERIDSDWVNSGYASVEVMELTSCMSDMSEHLQEMRRSEQWRG